MTPPPSHRRPGWRTGDIVRTAVIAMAVYAAARFFMFAHALIFLAFLGVLFGLAVAAGVEQLQRWRVPRGLAAGLIVLGAVGLLVGFGAWTGPTVRTQYHELRQRLPDAFAKVDQWVAKRDGLIGGIFVEPADTTNGGMGAQHGRTDSSITKSDSSTVVAAASTDSASDSLTHLKQLRKQLLSKVSGGAGRYVFPVISSTFAALSGILLLLFLSIYIGASAETYRRGMLSLIPHRSRQRWEQILAAASNALRRWLVTQLVAMLVIGVVSTTTLFFLGVRAAFPLGILAGLFEFVPTIGPILSAIPAIAMAFADSPEKALAVGCAYIVIQFLENHILIPLLMKEGVDLPPVLTILTQAAMALVFGFMGLFVAVPMLVLVTILVKMLYVEDVIGNGTDVPLTPATPSTS